jgi:hypothetical protein
MGVDLDILGSEVAAPEARCAVTFRKLQVNHDLLGLHRLDEGLLVVLGGASTLEHERILQIQPCAVQVNRRACASRGGDNASPVRVAPVNGGLDQLRLGDCASDLARGVGVCRARHTHLEDTASRPRRL